MSTQTAERKGPPVPKPIFKITNPLIKLMLLSPFHSGMSKQLMVLSWNGKKTGKRYSTPVGYVRQGNSLIVFTHASWWKNFTGGAPVTMRIEGKDVKGTAYPVSDSAEIKRMVQALNAVHNKERAQQMGFWVDDLAANAPEDVVRDVKGTYFVKIQL